MSLSLANHVQKLLRENFEKLTWPRHSWPSLASCYRVATSIPGGSRKAVAELMQCQAVKLRDKVRHRAWLRQPTQYDWHTSTPTAKELVEFAKTDMAAYHAKLNRPLAVRLSEYKAHLQRLENERQEWTGEVLRVAEVLRSVDRLFLVGKRWNGCMGYRGRVETSLHESMPTKEALSFLSELTNTSFGEGLTIYAAGRNGEQCVSGMDSAREFETASGDWRFETVFNGEKLSAKFSFKGEFANAVKCVL